MCGNLIGCVLTRAAFVLIPEKKLTLLKILNWHNFEWSFSFVLLNESRRCTSIPSISAGGVHNDIPPRLVIFHDLIAFLTVLKNSFPNNFHPRQFVYIEEVQVHVIIIIIFEKILPPSGTGLISLLDFLSYIRLFFLILLQFQPIFSSRVFWLFFKLTASVKRKEDWFVLKYCLNHTALPPLNVFLHLRRSSCCVNTCARGYWPDEHLISARFINDVCCSRSTLDDELESFLINIRPFIKSSPWCALEQHPPSCSFPLDLPWNHLGFFI